MSNTVLFEAHGAKFLDPAHVGSSVRWVVRAYTRPNSKTPAEVSVEAEVAFTDCSRSIMWSQDNYAGSDVLLKIQGAIKELKAMEKVLKRVKKLQEL